MRDVLKIAIPTVILGVAALMIAGRFIDPLPPRSIRIAAGSPEGAYTAAAQRYREILARDGVKVDVVTTAGAIENMRLLGTAGSGVDVAFVQGGTATAREATTELQSLASVFFEPLWIFVWSDVRATRLAHLRQRRIAIGVEGSGTQVLARELLVASGVTDDERLLSIGGPEAVNALLGRSVDAAFFVTARPSPLLDPLFRSARVQLMDVGQADAFARRYRYLSRVALSEGVLDLARDVPSHEIQLLAPAATLAARTNVHPAIVDLLMSAAGEVHGPGGLFERPGQFPSASFVEFPLHDEARRYLRSGPPFLRRHLPFWVAVMLERFGVFLVPLIGVVLPLLRIAPAAYRWQVQRRIHPWYGVLRALEARAARAATDADRARLAAELDDLERHVDGIRIPPGYAHELYQLRQHIHFVGRRICPDRVAP
jgi:TRAP-type uncharacterized transport system substrate-binding protein